MQEGEKCSHIFFHRYPVTHISNIPREKRQLEYLTIHIYLKFWKLQSHGKVFSLMVRVLYAHIRHDSFASIKGKNSYRYLLSKTFSQFFPSWEKIIAFHFGSTSYFSYDISKSPFLSTPSYLGTKADPSLLINICVK